MKQKRKKTLSTVESACRKIIGFRDFLQDLDDKIRISGQSESTLRSYAQRLASLCLHFGRLPQDISDKEINKYLAQMARKAKCASISNFKFTVYGLRYCYKMMGISGRSVHLPQIKYIRNLPVVLNNKECRTLFKAPNMLKHRVLLAMIYSAGLRAGEVSRLKIADIDFGRMMIHIRQSKNNKDRYVPLSPLIGKGLRKYLNICKPIDYLFNSIEPGSKLSVSGIGWVLNHAKKKCNFGKRITLHTLRHSYATHLLEFGMDIVSIKELLGHERIETTMVYLHVTNLNRKNLFSPYDKLYKRSKAGF